MEFHEFAACYPLLEGDSLDSLAESIRKHGLMEPIVLFQGKVLDGRNRMTCCTIAGVEPRFREFEGTDEEALQYVCCVNTDRRHLTKSQLAMAAAKAREHFDKLAKKRQHSTLKKGDSPVVAKVPQRETSRARDEAGKAFGVSGRMVDYATKVIEKGAPELKKAVEQGRMTVQTAASFLHEPHEVQAEEAKNTRRTYEKPVLGNTAQKQDQVANSDWFARKMADCAIAELKRIKPSDKNRKAAFAKVKDYVTREMESM